MRFCVDSFVLAQYVMSAVVVLAENNM